MNEEVPSFWVPLSEDAMDIMAAASNVALRARHGYIGTAHILLAILTHRRGSEYEVLKRNCANLDEMQTELDRLIASAETPEEVEPLSDPPKAKTALGIAMEYAVTHGHPRLRTGHILLGILEEGTGAGAKVLEARGITADSMGQELRSLLS